MLFQKVKQVPLPFSSFSFFLPLRPKACSSQVPPPPAHTHTCPNLSARVQEGWPRSDVCRCVLVPETLANIDEEKKERKTDFNVAPQQGHLGISMASFYAPSHARLSRCPCDVEPVTWSPRRMHAPHPLHSFNITRGFHHVLGKTFQNSNFLGPWRVSLHECATLSQRPTDAVGELVRESTPQCILIILFPEGVPRVQGCPSGSHGDLLSRSTQPAPPAPTHGA